MTGRSVPDGLAGPDGDRKPSASALSGSIPSAFTPGPWKALPCVKRDGHTVYSEGGIVIANTGTHSAGADEPANAHLIAAAPDHALICWAMCVQDGRWEEWVPYDGSGEFVFAGLRYATRLDAFGCPKLTPALRVAIEEARGEAL